jgi:hypothetical protein
LELRPTQIQRVAAALVRFGTVCWFMAALTFVAIFAVVKLAPHVDSLPLGAALMAFIGAALSPGAGLPMLLTGRMRVRLGMMGLLTGQAGDRAPVDSGAAIRIFGFILTLAGGLTLVIGVALLWSSLTRG